MARPTAAEALYPHLAHRQENAATHDRRGSLAEAMYPRPKPKSSNPHRDSLLRHLKEANAAADARLAKERGR